MKKSTRYILIAVLIAVLSLTMLVGCNNSVRVTVTVDGNEYKTLEVQKGTLLSEIEKPVIEGKVFVRWEFDGKEVNENEFVIERRCELVAVFEVQYLEVTFIDRGASYTEKVEYGKTVAEKVVEEREWCTFEGWFNGNEKYDFSKPVKTDLTLNAVWTEDLDGAKAALQAELSEAYVKAAYYGEYAAEAQAEFEKGVKAIASADKVDDAIAAFEAAQQAISVIRTYFDLINEIVEQYGAENYFDAQWTEIEAIFEDVRCYIRGYKAGVPTVEQYLNMAIEKADAVNTKEEDIEAADALKEIKVRQITNYAEEVIRNLGAESRAEVEKVRECLAEAVEAINAAQGTAELADVFAQYMAKLAEFIA